MGTGCCHGENALRLFDALASLRALEEQMFHPLPSAADARCPRTLVLAYAEMTFLLCLSCTSRHIANIVSGLLRWAVHTNSGATYHRLAVQLAQALALIEIALVH